MSIGELIDRIESGVSVRSYDQPASLEQKGVLKVSALADGRFDPTKNKLIRDDEVQRASINPTAGCTIVSRANAILLVGESAFVEQSCPNLYLPDKLWQLYPNRKLVDPYWFSLLLASPRVRASARLGATGTSSSMKNISQAAYLRIEVRVPPLNEQRRAAQILATINEYLAGLRRLVAMRFKLRRGLMLQLLTGQRRFHRFTTSPWRFARLGDHAQSLSQRNNGRLGPQSVMGVMKNVGLMPMRRHVRAASLARYQLVPPNGFAYNPMRLNIGSVGRNNIGEACLVSPDYIVFQTDENTLLPAFLDQVRRSHIWQRFVRPAGTGSVRVRIYFDDLAEMRIPLPSIEEQKRIADTLDTIDREIALLERQREAYNAQKRALMQRLLSGGIETLDSTA